MKTTLIHKYARMCACAMLTLLLTACHTTSRTAVDNRAGHTGRWHDVYMPVKVSMSSPVSISLSGRATMVNDSLINISMRVLGMEVAVMHCTADSVWLADKYHKYAFAESKQKVLGSHDMPLSELQNIMLGIDKDGRNLLTFNNPANGSEVRISFGDRTVTPAGNAAGQIRVDAPLDKGHVDAALTWNLRDADWNTYRRVNFTPPGKGYRYFTAADVLGMLKAM